MKNLFLCSLLAFSASICADSTEMIAAGCGVPAPTRACPPAPCAPPPCVPKPVVCKPKKPCRPICDPLSLSPAVSLCDTGIYAFLDVLFWRTDIGNSDWLSQVSPDSFDPGFINTQKEFNFKWGFRVGIGYTLENGEWDTNFSYTWFRNKHLQKIDNQAAGIKTSVLLHQDAADFDTVSNSWATDLNAFDWEIGSSFFINRRLILRTKGGLKAACVKQKIQIGLAAGESERYYLLRNRFLGVGPFAGVNSWWLLGSYGNSFCAIIGEFDAAVLYGQTKNYFGVGEDAALKEPVTFGGLNQKMPRPMIRSLIGLGWSSRLGPDTMNLSIKLGYEFQYWFRQNQLLHRPVQEADTTLPRLSNFRLSDDIVFHGVSLRLCFDF